MVDGSEDGVVDVSQPEKEVPLEVGSVDGLPTLGGVVVGGSALVLITRLPVRVAGKVVVVLVGGSVTDAALIGCASGIAFGDGCCCH